MSRFGSFVAAVAAILLAFSAFADDSVKVGGFCRRLDVDSDDTNIYIGTVAYRAI